MKKKLLSAILILLFALPLSAQTLRVMSFNVRYPAPGDGQNRWEFRRDMMVSVIREKNPDIIGTQELFQEQGDYIVEKAPEYTWFGISRRGTHEDEHMGVFYKKDKFRLVESGNFWLSETPEKPGSMSWNVDLPRMVTWGLFEMKAGGKRFYLFNTHFPHRAQDAEARLHAAEVLMERVSRLPKDVPLILTGDFNSAAPDAPPYKLISGELKDARLTAASRTGPDGTSSGFAGRTTGARIDWISYRGGVKAAESETIVHSEDGRYPSDHFPVLAVLELQ
jgi:endonuclease/exonuclease/phosphatase family metal-dependent hydrolase